MATSSPELRRLVVRGVAWKAVSQVIIQVFRVVVAVVLARLLTPTDYGLAGMVLVFTTFFFAFTDLGLGAALVQRRELTERDRSTAFWLSLASGTLVCGLGIGLSGIVAGFYGEPEVQPLLAVLSIGALLSAVSVTQAALLTREMRFRALELRLILATIVGAATGIVLAVAGYGPWAIIGQQLASGLVSAVLLWYASSWRPRLLFSRSSLRDVGVFGTRVLGANVFFSVNRNADNLLVGRFLGPAALGVYSLAYNIMLIPLSRLYSPVQEVLFPALSRTQDDLERTRGIVIRVTRCVTAISMPALLGLIIVAPDFVVTVLGERWEEAVPVIRILAVVGLGQGLTSINPRVMIAQGRARLLFWLSAISTGLFLGAFVLGLRWGVEGVAAAYALTALLVVQPASMVITARMIRLPLRRLAAELAGVALASILMATVVVWVRQLLVHEGASPAVRLGVAVAIGAFTYLAALPLCAHAVVDDLRGLVRRGAG